MQAAPSRPESQVSLVPDGCYTPHCWALLLSLGCPLLCPAGHRLVSNHSLHETSSVFVDSLTKTATIPQHSAPGPGPADASKVLAKGVGLSKAYMGQKSSFTVDCSKAGGCAGPSPSKNGRLERKAERPCLGKSRWEGLFGGHLGPPASSSALQGPGETAGSLVVLGGRGAGCF